jgi:hypothetical protein
MAIAGIVIGRSPYMSFSQKVKSPISLRLVSFLLLHLANRTCLRSLAARSNPSSRSSLDFGYTHRFGYASRYGISGREA